MRLYNGTLVGNNCLPKHFRMIVSGPTGSGKTTWVENFLKSKRLQEPIKHIYYCYPDDFDSPPVDWDTWNDTVVTFVPFMPDINFFKSMSKDSLIVFDDNFDQAIKNPSISQAMRIHSRRNFSVIMITQMFYELGPFSRIIRNQLNAVVLYRNFGDIKINRRIATQLGVHKPFLLAEKAVKDKKYEPIVILSNEIVETAAMRVQTNYLADNYSMCYS